MWSHQLPQSSPYYDPRHGFSNPEYDARALQDRMELEQAYPGWNAARDRAMRSLDDALNSNKVPGIDVQRIEDPRRR
jgi:hypothetical protein